MSISSLYIRFLLPIELANAFVQILSRYYEQETRRGQGGALTGFGATAAIGEGRAASFGGRAPTVSRFSSRGPDYIDVKKTPIDVLKPDILAPGHQVWAAWSPMSASEPILIGELQFRMRDALISRSHIKFELKNLLSFNRRTEFCIAVWDKHGDAPCRRSSSTHQASQSIMDTFHDRISHVDNRHQARQWWRPHNGRRFGFQQPQSRHSF